MASISFLLLAFVAFTSIQYAQTYPLDEVEVDDEPTLLYVHPEEDHQRYVRSLQPGAPNFPTGQQNQGGWKLDPSLSRGEDGNTQGNINVQHKGPNHEVNANWGKVIRGPGKAKPTYSIHGSWKW